jgi:tetratricopeptide (TPR) repeat protein
MSYSGNPSVSPDVRQRILSTFDQTLELAREGSRQEALLGCDFVLRMDSQFQPARVLQERLRTSTGAVSVDDLKNGQGAAGASPDDPFADLDGLSLDLPDLLPDPGAVRDEMQSLLDQRRFEELMAAAERERGSVMTDPELQRIVGAAQERMEAEPYVLKFLASARQALEAGQGDETGKMLDKARSLDPSHPGLAELDASRAALPAFQIPSPLQATAMPASLAFGGGDSESDRRIRELLDEGQAAFSAGDPQGAIDAWSRIFLIDIDHQEASRRIETARKLKAENERQVEEIFHDGLARLEASDPAGARQAFQRVLDIQPGYFAAREYLQQLDAGTVPVPRPAGSRDPRETPAAESALPRPSDLEAGAGALKEEILVPPEPGGQTAAAPERRPVKRTSAARDGGRARRLFLLVGGPVLLIALAGAWLAYQNWDRLFPNSQEEAVAGPNLSQDPIARAERLHQAGKTPIAINQLKRLPSTDPHYRQAQKLIAEWGGGSAAPAPGAQGAQSGAAAPGAASNVVPAAAPVVLDRRQLLLISAREAFEERMYIKAVHRLEQAEAIAKLDGSDAQLLTDARAHIEPLAKQLGAFRDHEWEYVLQDLWRMREANPGDRDVNQLIVDCYYNLALRDLQRADTTKAAEKLKEALNLQQDETIQRHLLFAQTYQQRPKDLLYKIYVKYLQYR